MEEFVIKDKRGQYWLIAVVSAVSFMMTLYYSSLNISLASIAQYFNIKVGLVAWLPISYLLIITSTLLGFAKLGDIQGYKKVFIAGIVVFIAGATLCSISPNFPVLFVSAGLIALGEAMYSPIGIALLTFYLPSELKGKALGLYATFQGLGLALGPAIGGYINSHFNWRGNFIIIIPLALVIMAAALKIVPSKQSKPSSTRFDFAGALLLLIFLASLLYAVNSGTKTGWNNPVIIACLISAAVSFLLFYRQERRIPYPILDFGLFKNLNFSFAVGASFLGLSLNMGFTFLFPFYLQMLKNLDISRSGLLMMIPSLMMMILAPIAGALSDRIGPRKVCLFGMLVATTSFVIFSFLDLASGMIHISLSLACLGTGMGFFIAPNSKQVMTNAPADKQGIASGVYKIALNAGSSIGIAMFMLVLAQVVLFDVEKLHILLSTVSQHPDILMLGFRGAFIFGIFVGASAFICTLLSRDKS